MGSCQHAVTSPEYQSAAAVEGFADYYALTVWWSTSSPTAIYLQGNVNVVNGLITTTLTTNFNQWINTACGGPPCDAGVAVETDWMSALWNFNLGLPDPSPDPQLTLSLLPAAYPWPVTGTTIDYWNNFTAASATVLSPALQTKFLTVANQAGIDR